MTRSVNIHAGCAPGPSCTYMTDSRADARADAGAHAYTGSADSSTSMEDTVQTTAAPRLETITGKKTALLCFACCSADRGRAAYQRIASFARVEAIDLSDAQKRGQCEFLREHFLGKDRDVLER